MRPSEFFEVFAVGALVLSLAMAVVRRFAKSRLDCPAFKRSVSQWRKRESVLRYVYIATFVAFFVLYEYFRFSKRPLSREFIAFTVLAWSAVVGFAGLMNWTQYKSLKADLPERSGAALMYCVSLFIIQISFVGIYLVLLFLRQRYQ